MADRQATAKTHPEYVAAKEKYFAALQKYESFRNKRATESLVVDAWRSVNSNRRQGQ